MGHIVGMNAAWQNCWYQLETCKFNGPLLLGDVCDAVVRKTGYSKGCKQRLQQLAAVHSIMEAVYNIGTLANRQPYG